MTSGLRQCRFSRPARGSEGPGLRQRRPPAAGLAEALHDFLPPARVAVQERDPPVGLDPLELDERGAAPCPPLVGEVLLGRVGAGAPAKGDRQQRRQGSAQLWRHPVDWPGRLPMVTSTTGDGTVPFASTWRR